MATSGPAPVPLKERILRGISIDERTGCWIWTLSKCGSGYGKLKTKGKFKRAHRISYEVFKGEIPCGLEVDHLCREKTCVNPDHLEPVTHDENIRRASACRAHSGFCKRGHKLDGVRKNNPKWRYCKTCVRDRARKYRARLAE